VLALQAIASRPGGSLGDRDAPFDQAMEVALKGAPGNAGSEGHELLDAKFAPLQQRPDGQGLPLL
jgi:hypothetical protein